MANHETAPVHEDAVELWTYMVSPESPHDAVASTVPAFDVCGFAQAHTTVLLLMTVLTVFPAGTTGEKLPHTVECPPSIWDTESYESMRPNTVPSALEYR